MKGRAVGRSGLRVSELTYGTWLHATEGHALRMMRAALDSGYWTFDTADVYGSTRTESVLGLALKGVRRESYVISTKVFARTGPNPNERGLSRKHIVEACEGSLRRLGVEHIDLYSAHRFDDSVPLDETLRAFDDLIRQGKILYVGVSEWTAQQIDQALDVASNLGADRIVANQTQYNLLWRVPETEVTDACKRGGLSQMAWSPLAQGLLSGKYRADSPEALPPGSRAAGPLGAQFPRHALRADVLGRIDAFRRLAAEAGLTASQLALRWLLGRETVASAVIGASREDQLAENLVAADEPLDSELLLAVEAVFADVAERRSSLMPSEPADLGRV